MLYITAGLEQHRAGDPVIGETAVKKSAGW